MLMRKFFLLCCCFFAARAMAQSPLIMPMPEQQFFTPTGGVCSGCFVYTYQSGTFTPQATFTDSTGLTQNTNPIVLNSAGFPQTAIGTQVGIWLSATLTYRIALQNAAHSVLYTVDGITGQLPGATSNPLTILDATCNQFTVGLTNFQTGLCFPAPASSIILTFPNSGSDTMVARNTTDTLSNKTLNAPLFNSSGCAIINGPGTYVCIPNANPTGTTTNLLAILTNAPSQATIAALTTTGGIVGICVSGCGSAGTATIQQSGASTCVFDGATTSNDYVQVSSGTAGNCHDVGAAYPTSGQVLGRVLSTNGSGGLYSLILFNPELRAIAPGSGTPTFSGGGGVAGSCGTSICVDRGGTVRAVVSSPVTTNGGIVNVNWGGTYLNSPHCVISADDLGTATTTTYLTSNAGQMQILNGSGSNLAVGTYNWNWVCTYSNVP